MDIMTDLLAWFEAHPWVVIGLSVLSILSFFGALLSLPWLVTRIPYDYFASPKRRRSRFAQRHPVLRWGILILRNLLGLLILCAGIVMLFIPGQGLLTMLAGLMLMNYPGKYRLERWIVRRPPLLKAIDAIRLKHGARPLQF